MGVSAIPLVDAHLPYVPLLVVAYAWICVDVALALSFTGLPFVDTLAPRSPFRTIVEALVLTALLRTGWPLYAVKATNIMRSVVTVKLFY